VRTVVVSDLHLGARTDVDVLRRPAALEALVAALADVERLVILGDLLELRHGPIRDALAAARPVLAAVGAALPAGAEVVLVPGNHDHRLVAPWLDWRERAGRAPLGLEERAGPDASAAARALAEMLAPARLDVAYPGLWLADGVFATHGHYLDVHVTIPGFERLGAGLLGRSLRTSPDDASEPDDYELVLAPMYALLDAIAARALDGRGGERSNASSRAWALLTADEGRPWRARLLGGAFPLALAALGRAGLGELSPDLSGPGLRRATLAAMRTVVARLGVDARHVVFGHTHRAGPLEGDDRWEWALPRGAQLHNTGSWVFESMYLDRGWGSPYWPGGAVRLDDDGEPRHVRLLDGVDAALLAPPQRSDVSTTSRSGSAGPGAGSAT
jgi:calcineurin-like phosphoesterase family protein